MLSFNWDTGYPYGKITLYEIVEFVKKHYVIAGTCIISVGGYLLLRKVRAGGVCRSTARLDGKTVVITGANRGLGKAAALSLASRGARVIMGCRDIMKGERAAKVVRQTTNSGNVFCLQLDLASFESIRKFTAQIYQRQEQVNVLINNAGVLTCPKLKTDDGFEMQFGVNYLGHFLLTNLLLEQLKASAPSRILNVSSSAHRGEKLNFDDLNHEESYNPFTSYQRSKLAVILFTRALAEKLEGTGVTVNTIDPGLVETPGFYTLSSTGPWYRGLITWVFAKLFCKSPEEGCQTYTHCAVCPQLEKVSGKYFKDCKECEPSLESCNIGDEERLWNVSMRMAGLQEVKK